MSSKGLSSAFGSEASPPEPSQRRISPEASPPEPSSRAERPGSATARADEELLRRLQRGDSWAKAVLFDRYAPLVERIVRRILGSDRHIQRSDVVHDAFVSAFASVAQVKSAAALTSWMQSVAVHTACKAIRRRRARAWLRFFAPEEIPDGPPLEPDPDLREAHDRTYDVLARLPVEERAAFALRFIEGMELTEVARACDVSLATIKRRLARAEQRFVTLATKDPVLAVWLKEGGRWKT